MIHNKPGGCNFGEAVSCGYWGPTSVSGGTNSSVYVLAPPLLLSGEWHSLAIKDSCFLLSFVYSISNAPSSTSETHLCRSWKQTNKSAFEVQWDVFATVGYEHCGGQDAILK